MRPTLIKASDYSHVVIGGGVVGLAIAARLSRVLSNSVLLIERHHELGTETSSRNSEVIHAGIYHPLDTLRSQLCIKGKNMIYETARKYPGQIQLRQCGKWVVAQDDKQADYLEKMVQLSKRSGVPLEWVSLENAKKMEPHVIANTAILNSPTTGIISAHSLMSFYEAEIQANGVDVSLLTNVESVQYPGNSYALACKDKQSNEITQIKADAVINAAGHGSVAVSNSLLPSDRQLTAYYAKGNYFAYTSSFPKVNRLIYPCPTDHASLGTHLTIDLAGRIRFGPDVEWVESSEDLKANPKNLQAAIKEISIYLKDIDPTHLQADYAGIRPKIISTGSQFQDFVIRKEEGFPGFINLLNIESPGLTASMAIAEYVESLL